MLRALAEDRFPRAERIILVQDNLNTHDLASRYHALAPEQARALLESFEFHFTPKHASWLNLAECALSALARQCLHRRIGEIEILRTEVEAWVSERHRAEVTIDWRFTAADARIKLKRLYPSYHVR